MTRATRTTIVVAVALGAAGVASYAVFQAVQRIPGRVIEVRQVPVVAASAALPPGTRLTAAHLRVLQWPADAPLPGAHADVAALVDQRLGAAVLPNEPITDGKLTGSGAAGALPSIIPSGMRAITVPVNEVVGVGLFVEPGMQVDVLATFDTDGGAVAHAVVENVQVLSIGTRFDLERTQAAGASVPPTVVTLAVTPDQAERITLVSTNAQVRLALRNPDDAETGQTAGVRMAGLLSGARPPARPVPAAVQAAAPRPKPQAQAAVVPLPPPSAPRPPYMIEAIRASRRSAERVLESESAEETTQETKP